MQLLTPKHTSPLIMIIHVLSVLKARKRMRGCYEYMMVMERIKIIGTICFQVDYAAWVSGKGASLLGANGLPICRSFSNEARVIGAVISSSFRHFSTSLLLIVSHLRTTYLDAYRSLDEAAPGSLSRSIVFGQRAQAGIP